MITTCKEIWEREVSYFSRKLICEEENLKQTQTKRILVQLTKKYETFEITRKGFNPRIENLFYLLNPYFYCKLIYILMLSLLSKTPYLKISNKFKVFNILYERDFYM